MQMEHIFAPCYIYAFFHSTGKESMEVETQAALKKLPPSNTRQIHGNPPGLSNSLCQQINYDFDYARQNKGKQEEDKSKHARTSSSRLLDGKVSCHNCSRNILNCTVLLRKTLWKILNVKLDGNKQISAAV